MHSCHNQDAHDTKEMVSIACSVAKDKKIAMPGDPVIITAGVPFGHAGSTNLLRIAKIIADKDLTWDYYMHVLYAHMHQLEFYYL